MVRNPFLALGLIAVFMLPSIQAQAQDEAAPPMLLQDITIQIEATDALNAMYNFKFEKAEREYQKLKAKYPKHPLPYFLLGLSTFWRIVPNDDVSIYDNRFYAYMDSTIEMAEELYDDNEKNIEAAFFLSAAYGFKGRLLSDRKEWTPATLAGRNSLKYLEKSRGYNELSPEFEFGEALYNYYAVWIPENYRYLRPILAFFPDGNKELGIKQLQNVAHNAFYTRTEAQLYLMRIFANDEHREAEALPMAEYLATTYPDNPYFERFYARMCFTQGQFGNLEKLCLGMLDKINRNMPGYEATSGRYAAFYLGYYYRYVVHDKDKAKLYIQAAVDFARESKSYDAGYFLYGLAYLAQMADEEKDTAKASLYYKEVLRYADKKHETYKEAHDYFKNQKKLKRKLKKVKDNAKG